MATLAALLSLAATSAQANFTCSGAVWYLAVNNADVVYAGVAQFGVWAICSLKPANYLASADSCKAWYAGLLAAKRSNSNILMYFDTANGGNNGQECTALGSWTISQPYHLEF
jgi:hypothetical protein